MGAGLIKEKITNIPDIETFQKLTIEYDKLKTAGLSAIEIHSLMVMRLNNTPSVADNQVLPKVSPNHSNNNSFYESKDNKSDDVRETESTNINTKTINHKTQPVQPKILLALMIDDSPVASKVGAKVLKGLNFEVITAESAQLGYDILKARKHEINIVFLDVVMPNVDGVECLSWIKGDPNVANIPVYMLSGLDDQTLMEVCIENGAEGMLLKPLNANIVKTILLEHNFEAKTTNVSSINTPGQLYSATISPTETPKITESISSKPPTVPKTKEGSKIYDTTISNLSSGHQATAFRLTDNNLKEFTYPSITNKKYMLFLFLPTIFLPDLYVEKTGFLRWFFESYDYITSNHISVVCISSDLPTTLEGGRNRFNLPFQCLSDPTLVMSKKYIGTFNVGLYIANQKKGNSSLEYNNQINTIAPNLGLILIDKNRNVVNKWVGITNDGTPDLHSNFPDIKSWIDSIRLNDHIQHNNEVNELSNILDMINSSTTNNNTNSNTSNPITNINIKTAPILKNSSKVVSIASSTIPSANPSGANTPTKNLLRKSNRNKKENTVNFNISTNFPSNDSLNELNYKNKYILVVDDSSVSSRVVTKKLDSLGYKADTAYNGLIAFDILKKEPTKYFLILVDIMMPVCDGIEFLKMVKGEANLQNILVIMLSGLSNSDIQGNCMSLGAAGVMQKPFDEQSFQDIINRYIK